VGARASERISVSMILMQNQMKEKGREDGECVRLLGVQRLYVVQPNGYQIDVKELGFFIDFRSTCGGWRHHVCSQHQFSIRGVDGTVPYNHNMNFTTLAHVHL
jgi:hypothetical protein